MDHDIALLVPAELGTVTIAAPEHDNQYALPLGDAVVIGWGATAERGGTTPQLMRVWVDIQNAAICQADRQEGMPSVQITENMLCAGLPEGGRDACQGDSGALFGAPIGNGKYVQLYIVSWRVGGARPSSSASMPGSGAMPRFGRRWPTSGLISPRNRVGKAPLDAE